MLDRDAIERYLSEVPLEIRNAVKPLDNDKNWAIYIALLKHQQMRYKDIKEVFSATSSGDIDRHLKSLSAAGLIAKEARKIEELGDLEKSFYCPTVLGKSLVRALFKGVLPQPRYKESSMAPLFLVEKSYETHKSIYQLQLPEGRISYNLTTIGEVK